MKNETDKAKAIGSAGRSYNETSPVTERDWIQHIQFGEMAFTVSTPPAFGRQATNDLVALIVKAVNEYKALNSVAEAAEEYYNTPRIERDGHKLEKTLASLASLRAGEPEKE